MTDCINIENGCNFRGSSINYLKHLMICEYFICDNCKNWTGTSKNLENEHSKECVGSYIKCKNSDIGCKYRDLEEKIPEHEIDCEFNKFSSTLRQIINSNKQLHQQVNQLVKENDNFKILANTIQLENENLKLEIKNLKNEFKLLNSNDKNSKENVSNKSNNNNNVSNNYNVNSIYKICKHCSQEYDMTANTKCEANYHHEGQKWQRLKKKGYTCCYSNNYQAKKIPMFERGCVQGNHET
eukprot:TRINITY_DN1844_c1_g1_i1.p1 TRINITY_DN1844_c1_g1~~TRINITY_DN1844_c1_g1_i1.p1  ORF type:complete len:240 (+),score=33.89 TRINITY_DN1844_c1_g1_i1:69-788(+)